MNKLEQTKTENSTIKTQDFGFWQQEELKLKRVRKLVSKYYVQSTIPREEELKLKMRGVRGPKAGE